MWSLYAIHVTVIYEDFPLTLPHSGVSSKKDPRPVSALHPNIACLPVSLSAQLQLNPCHISSVKQTFSVYVVSVRASGWQTGRLRVSLSLKCRYFVSTLWQRRLSDEKRCERTKSRKSLSRTSACFSGMTQNVTSLLILAINSLWSFASSAHNLEQ